ncbi:hypothetical protein E2C01_074715 [Portunus trituberculatus]|uniref:Uncharacterized protein n=1 Tax=Portunus trituberculatus TaxID=210409 RepID=A0A5B7IDV8_PORTR|nr:hypothetical protein [Portunus trituberculatus]
MDQGEGRKEEGWEGGKMRLCASTSSLRSLISISSRLAHFTSPPGRHLQILGSLSKSSRSKSAPPRLSQEKL